MQSEIITPKMKFTKIAFLTVAAVVSTIASTLQAQRPVFVSNESGRNSNWSSASFNSSFFPGSGNPFERAIISGDSIRSLTSSGSTTRFKPKVFIIMPGDTITLTNDVDYLDTLYIYGVLNMGANGSDNDIKFYSESSSNRDLFSGSNYNSSRTRRGTIFVMTNGRIIGGGNVSGDETAFENMGVTFQPTSGNRYNVTGPRMATYNTSGSADASVRFATFVPSFLPLPVDLASFTVNSTEIGHEVSWTAIGESNRNNFILEISTNGRDFTQVAEISGNPEANKQNYDYLLNRQDRAFFVRLSETNTTGYTHVLATKYVTLNNAAIASCNVYPTVVAATEELNLMFSEINSYQVQVINYNGVSFINSTIETATENEVSRLELSKLPAGQYLVKVYSPSGFSKTEKIIITE